MEDDVMGVQPLDVGTVRIRPIAAADGDALVRFHEGLTDETTRLRFFALHRHLTPGEVERFTHVDHRDREALVALDGDDIVAVGRYDRLPDSSDAEVAFVVADGWQGRGAGTNLLLRLARRARTEGIRRLVADMLADNHRMRDVFRRSGLMVDSETDAGVVHVVLDLGLDPGALDLGVADLHG